MTNDARMFNSININSNDGYDSITFGDNDKGEVKGLGKIVISNDLSISNALKRNMGLGKFVLKYEPS
jgi:hypothetical protein